MTTGSAIRPRKAFGKPSRLACQVSPTVAQEIVEEMLQPRSANGSSASFTASMDSTRDAQRPMMLEISISMNAPVW